MRLHSPHDYFKLALLFAVCLSGLRGNRVMADDDSRKAVYVLSNEQEANRLIVLNRDDHGGISLKGTVATGGLGTGSGLGSQGALVLRGDRTLYAVNAGDSTITTFLVRKRGPEAVQVVNSGGLRPISLTARDDTLYVLNQGAAVQDVDQVTGFQIDEDNRQLTILPSSTRGLRPAMSVRPR